jgi:hypothetical protein
MGTCHMLEQWRRVVLWEPVQAVCGSELVQISISAFMLFSRILYIQQHTTFW